MTVRQTTSLTWSYVSQSQPGSLCQFSYCVDTDRDKSLWQAMKVWIVLRADDNMG